MTTLAQSLLEPEMRPQVVAALAQLADTEIGRTKGVSGAMLKTAYAGAKKAGDSVPKTLDRALPALVDTLEPYWQSFQAAPGGGFGTYLHGRADQVSDALLAAVDRRSSRLEGPLAKGYGAFRGRAKGHVVDALPGLGAVVERFAG